MTTSNELTCQELVELVTEYLEGMLSPEERARFDAHLAICSGCRTYLEQFRQMIRTLGRLTEASVPPQARDELLMVFRHWKRGGPPSAS
ncbi:MAG: zf-HC2 domain-containing protein [Armatimonadetes bacterium]|nr:zf-HC2 domain-containing protein [Armatimonadota bacterium]